MLMACNDDSPYYVNGPDGRLAIQVGSFSKAAQFCPGGYNILAEHGGGRSSNSVMLIRCKESE